MPSKIEWNRRKQSRAKQLEVRKGYAVGVTS